MLDNVPTREQPVLLSYKDMENLEFEIILTQNHCTNPNSFHICFPIKTKKSTNVNNDIDDDMITINNFFYHRVKEIKITKYGSDKQLMPTSFLNEIYQYSYSMLKHLPEKKKCSIVKKL